MKYHVGTDSIPFYDVQEYIASRGGGKLIPLNQLEILIVKINLEGTFWTGTKISCSRQAVISINNNNIESKVYDKTFKARVIFIKNESP